MNAPQRSDNMRPICSHAAREVLKVGFLQGMNRILTNNCNSQHADTVAQGTNSRSFQIPCATAPQIVANRYLRSRKTGSFMMLRSCLFIVLCLSSCSIPHNDYKPTIVTAILKCKIDGKTWSADSLVSNIDHHIDQGVDIFNYRTYSPLDDAVGTYLTITLPLQQKNAFDTTVYDGNSMISIIELDTFLVFRALLEKFHVDSCKRFDISEKALYIHGTFISSFVSFPSKADTVSITEGEFEVLYQ